MGEQLYRNLLARLDELVDPRDAPDSVVADIRALSNQSFASEGDEENGQLRLDAEWRRRYLTAVRMLVSALEAPLQLHEAREKLRERAGNKSLRLQFDVESASGVSRKQLVFLNSLAQAAPESNLERLLKDAHSKLSKMDG